jgi:YggT family protein
VLGALLILYLLVLMGRWVIDLVQSFARSWKPTGLVLVLAEGIYTLTDPPLKLLRRFIPPLRLGNLAVDLSFTVLFVVVLAMVIFVRGL